MPNPIIIEFETEGIDDATARLNKLNGKLDDIKADMQDPTGGAAAPGPVDNTGLDAMISKLSIASVAGVALSKALDVTKDTLRDYIKAAEETPELFTADELARAQAFSSEVDELKDSFTRLKISIVDANAEGLTKGVDALGNYVDRLREANDEVPKWLRFLGPAYGIYLNITAATEDATESTSEFTEAIASSDQAMLVYAESAGKHIRLIKETGEEVAKQTKAISLLSVVAAEQSSLDAFNRQQETLKDRIDKTIVSIMQAERQYGVYSQQVANLKDQYNSLNETMAENVQEQEKNTQRMILERSKELLSVGGLTAEEEKYLVNQGLAMGVYSETAAAHALTIIDSATNIANAFKTQSDSVITGIDSVAASMDSIDGKRVTVYIDAQYSGFGGFTPGGFNPLTDSPRSPFGDMDFLTQEVVRRLGQ